MSAVIALLDLIARAFWAVSSLISEIGDAIQRLRGWLIARESRARREASGLDGCLAPLKRDCTLTPAEIDAVLAMRAGLPAPPVNLGGTAHPRETAGALAGYEFYGDRTPLVSCEGCGIVRVVAVVSDPDVCPSCGVVGRQPVVT